MKRTLRVLSQLLTLLTVLSLMAPAMAAGNKPTIVPETLWAGCEYYNSLYIENLPESAKLLTIKSSKPDVIKVVKEGSGLYDHHLVPLKTGKSKISVKYKSGSKTGTIAATFTVKKYPNPLSFVKINGNKIDIKSNKYYYTVNKYTGTKTTITVKPAKGWKIDSTWGYMEKADNNSDFSEFSPRSGKAFTIKKGYNAGAFFTLVNGKNERIQYGINFYRK